jgi:hypothetical protein
VWVQKREEDQAGLKPRPSFGDAQALLAPVKRKESGRKKINKRVGTEKTRERWALWENHVKLNVEKKKKKKASTTTSFNDGNGLTERFSFSSDAHEMGLSARACETLGMCKPAHVSPGKTRGVLG